ncbi:MAG: hypothetical protein ACFFD1_10120 [Candidatus Thorarchaeota archaeon]
MSVISFLYEKNPLEFIRIGFSLFFLQNVSILLFILFAFVLPPEYLQILIFIPLLGDLIAATLLGAGFYYYYKNQLKNYQNAKKQFILLFLWIISTLIWRLGPSIIPFLFSDQNSSITSILLIFICISGIIFFIWLVYLIQFFNLIQEESLLLVNLYSVSNIIGSICLGTSVAALPFFGQDSLTPPTTGNLSPLLYFITIVFLIGVTVKLIITPILGAYSFYNIKAIFEKHFFSNLSSIFESKEKSTYTPKRVGTPKKAKKNF